MNDELPYTVMFCGSRKMVPGMTSFIREIVKRAKVLDYRVIIGDAVGVDREVGLACIEFKLPFMVVGLGSLPRYQVDLQHYATVAADAYADRDRFMVDLSDHVVAIWNGKSQGTKAAADYARLKGKKVNVYVNFAQWIEQEAG